MSRITPLTIDELSERGVDVTPFLHDFAELPGSVATLGYRPDILNGTLVLWQAVMGAGSLPDELKYLAGYLASMSAGCQYCSAHTASNAGTVGDSAKVAAVWEYERSPLFTEAERAALRFAQLAGMSPSGVRDEDVDAMKEFYSETEIVELLAVVALYGFFNRWNDSLATHLEPTPFKFANQTIADHGWHIGNHA
ncbi:carboxymuconolactone decarboxylase family protein [Croceicoccus ponticola]|uniref:Carboxymuconolactone decarboxylase family protein n=1 Tax=Croceicoccus ponticola TaxID=2217664 RepID=A0A437GZN1_9SPHN|nr:carboxymuconolactone decarboxylase family protein [Croceicoccus ponticola]RVQ68793.1 carboxymuconolactone decarboxylase family protein [Croceicoccus ponticola]